MAQLTDILSSEKMRTSPEQIKSIMLYQEGSFYRAYEWSAWLCVRYISKFKVTHRRIKSSDQTIAFIGFPLTSLEKFSPEGSVVNSIDNGKQIQIILPDTLFPADLEPESLESDFSHWKESLPIEQNKKADDKVETTNMAFGNRNPQGLTSIMVNILSFPIEKKSPIECMLFLADVKKQIADIL